MSGKDEELCILSEVTIPGVAEGNIRDTTMEPVCSKCNKLKKDCICDK